MTNDGTLLLLGEIGADHYLAIDEIPSEGREPVLSHAWSAYAAHFGRFTGARLDPLHNRLDNAVVPLGRLRIPAGDLILVVGTGPSLHAAIGELKNRRGFFHLVTSLRGADALAGYGIEPDLVLIEHQSCLEAELSARERAGRLCVGSGWMAIEPKTPPSLFAHARAGRVFIPEIWLGWGLWPATAVATALGAGATCIGLLGIDLGDAGGVTPAFRPLAALLSVLSHIPGITFVDCGESAAPKPGWSRRPLSECVTKRVTSEATVDLTDGPTADDRLVRERDSLEALRPRVANARQGLLQAQGGASVASSTLRPLLDEVLRWGDDSAVRHTLQETLGLSFLPRFWRTGIDYRQHPAHLWRPTILALEEMVSQANALEAKLSYVESARPKGRSDEGDEADAPLSRVLGGPTVLVMPLTYACNVQCAMCTIWQRDDPQVVARETLRRRLDDPLIKAHLEVVNLTGGEPFLRADLPEVVSDLIDLCPLLQEIGIPTNGSMPERILGQVGQILALLPPPVTLAMTVSLDGGAEVHDHVRGVQGLFAKSLKTLRALVKLASERRNLSVGINMTVMPMNVDDIHVVDDLARDAGVGLTLTPATESDIYIGSADVRDQWQASPSQWSGVADAIEAYGKLRGLTTLADASRILRGAERQSACVFWDRGFFLDADGAFHVCPVTSAGRVGQGDRPDAIRQLWGSESHLAALRKLRQSHCLSCLSNCMETERDCGDIVRKIGDTGKPVVIFGAGSGGRKVLRKLLNSGVAVTAFVDNYASRQAASLSGIPVLPWDDGRHCRDKFVVVASRSGATEISRQLERIGLRENGDYVRYF
ncbi:MAG: radical SAM protein [Acidobacteria bacterium]|nr:radical SAM protein [Acidobacteriota bacterium]